MLEHPDRHDPVERTGDVAVVAEQEFFLMARFFSPARGVRDLQLLGRERNAGHIGAGHLGQIEPEPAQARADVEHAVAAPINSLAARWRFLAN